MNRGCPRGAPASYCELYSANRLKYPLVRKRLMGALWALSAQRSGTQRGESA